MREDERKDEKVRDVGDFSLPSVTLLYFFVTIRLPYLPYLD
jgi:hypothetical protein